MTQSILGALAALAGLSVTLLTLVLLAACAPNSTPALSSALKALAIGAAGVGLGAFIGSVAAFVIGRQGAAIFIGSLPWLWSGLSLLVLTLIDKGRIDPSAGSAIARAVAMLVFTPLGIMLLVVGVREMTRQAMLLRSAEPVPAIVVERSVVASQSADTDRRPLRDNSTTTYEPVVRFRYAVDGEMHESTMLRPTVIAQTYPSESAAAERVAAYEPGTVVTAHVASSHPDLGFLEHTASLGPLIFTTLGLCVPSMVWAFTRVLM